MGSESMVKITVGGFMGILIALSLILGVGNKETIKTLWQKNKDLGSQFIELRTDVDILKGKMQVYENLPVDLRSRIEILETRYDNLIFFKNRLNEKEKKLLNKNIERLQNQSEKE